MAARVQLGKHPREEDTCSDEPPKKKAATPQPFAGFFAIFVGTCGGSVRRQILLEAFQKHGGKVHDTLEKRTTHVISGFLTVEELVTMFPAHSTWPDIPLMVWHPDWLSLCLQRKTYWIEPDAPDVPLQLINSTPYVADLTGDRARRILRDRYERARAEQQAREQAAERAVNRKWLAVLATPEERHRNIMMGLSAIVYRKGKKISPAPLGTRVSADALREMPVFATAYSTMTMHSAIREFVAQPWSVSAYRDETALVVDANGCLVGCFDVPLALVGALQVAPGIVVRVDPDEIAAATIVIQLWFCGAVSRAVSVALGNATDALHALVFM